MFASKSLSFHRKRNAICNRSPRKRNTGLGLEEVLFAFGTVMGLLKEFDLQLADCDRSRHRNSVDATKERISTDRVKRELEAASRCENAAVEKDPWIRNGCSAGYRMVVAAHLSPNHRASQCHGEICRIKEIIPDGDAIIGWRSSGIIGIAGKQCEDYC